MESYTYELINVYNNKTYLASVTQYSLNNEVWFVSEDYSSSSYNATYEIELRNNELVEYKTIRCKEYYISERVETVFKRWADLEIKKKKSELLQSIEDKVHAMNVSCSEFLDSISNILKYTLSVNDEVDWNKLKDKREYTKIKPKEPLYLSIIKYPNKPTKREYKKYGEKPNPQFYQYQPKFTFWDKLSSSKKKLKIDIVKKLFENDLEKWSNNCLLIDNYNKGCDEDYDAQLIKYNQQLIDADAAKRHLMKEYEELVRQWDNDKSEFYAQQEALNKSIDEQKDAYMQGDTDALLSYNQIVLENSIYPDIIDKLFHIEYLEDTHTLLIDYLLPHYNRIPLIKEYKYIKSKNDISEKKRSDTELNAIYESICYQLTIRTLHEVFEADVADAVRTIVFNGFAKELDLATGNHRERCVLSVKSDKDAFLQISLENIDVKICFREALRGISGAKLNKFDEIIPFAESTRIWRFEREKQKASMKVSHCSGSDEKIINIVDSVKQFKSIPAINFAVKGLIYRTAEEQLLASRLNIGDVLLLEKEPDNKFDEFAIKVTVADNKQIGYVEKDFAKEIFNNFDNIDQCVVSKINNGKSIDCPFIYANVYFKA